MADEPTSHDREERLTIPVHEEVLEPHVRTVERGRIRVHTSVETVPSEMLVEAGRDEITIERVAVDRPVDIAPEPWQDGDTLVIPVVEEVVVTETRLVVREEVRITRKRLTERVPVRASVRKERVEIEQIDLDHDTTQ